MEDPDRGIAEALTAPSTEERLRVSNVRLMLAQVYLKMKRKAYDALLHHGINFRELRAFKDQTLLEDARNLTLARGQEAYIEWCRRVEHDIDAAITRKSFRRV